MAIMDAERDFLSEFLYAFVEELRQGGISFKNARDEKFVKNEYPHYSDSFSKGMNRVYGLWSANSDELAKERECLRKAIGAEKADKITADKSLRFFILKNFHDSYIDRLSYEEGKGVLTLGIDYDDAFCKIPYDTDMTLTFRGVSDYFADFTNSGDVLLLVEDNWYEIVDGKIKLIFSLMDINNEWEECQMSFTYETLEIH